MMASPILLGTNIGVLFNTLLPDIALSAVFLVFLFIVGPYLLIKSLQMKREQKELLRKEKEELE